MAAMTTFQIVCRCPLPSKNGFNWHDGIDFWHISANVRRCTGVDGDLETRVMEVGEVVVSSALCMNSRRSGFRALLNAMIQRMNGASSARYTAKWSDEIANNAENGAIGW